MVVVVVVVGGCRWHCGSGRSGGKPTQWRLWQQDQLIEHRQERGHGPGRRSKGSVSSSGFKTALISSRAMDKVLCTHSAVHPP